MKQDIKDVKTEFTQPLAALLGSMDQRFENINSQMINIKHDFTKTMEDIVTDSLSKVKDSINEGLRAEYLKLQ